MGLPMDMIETQVWKEPWDVNRRLAELELRRGALLKVVDVALSAGADATSYHPANAEGTFRYQYGVWALRDQFVGEEWLVHREESVETIRNDKLKVKVAFVNVSIACDDEQKPKPRSPKGAGSERVCSGNLFGDLPIYAPRQDGEWATYYLMVDGKGAAELTRPVISGDTFSYYVERIYLSDGQDADPEKFSTDNDDIVNDFDPLVVRK